MLETEGEGEAREQRVRECRIGIDRDECEGE